MKFKDDKTYYEVKIDGITREYEAGTSYLDITKDYAQEYDDDILLVEKNSKLSELHKKLTSDCELVMVTASQKAGRQTYERSTVFVMLKAMYDEYGASKLEKVVVEFSTGNGLFIVPYGDLTVNQDMIDKIKERMHDLIMSAIPIKKKSIDTDEAIELFHKLKMYDKEKLFRYRRVSKVNIYSIGSFQDYFYGYMVNNTSYIKQFDIQLYKHGLILMIPTMHDTHNVPAFKPTEMVYNQLWEATEWGHKLGLADVGSLDDQISAGKVKDIILTSEALMEKRIGDVAEAIASHPEKRIVMIAGPSSSGKTTFSHRLSIQLSANGLVPHPIEVDNYFKNREDTPKDEQGNYNFECLEAMDVVKFNEDMDALLSGKRIEMPRFNFKSGIREYKGDFLQLGEKDILVIEGIHCLNEKLSATLPRESKYKIYISALTSLNIDEHNRVLTTDGRLIRRMVRDNRTRGTDPQRTIAMWPSVRRGEEENIFPYQDSADVVFNSSQVYELAVLKQYAEPLLFGIPKNSEEYLEAKRLLKFLDYFLSIPTENIPNNSIIREFIGGSCFNV